MNSESAFGVTSAFRHLILNWGPDEKPPKIYTINKLPKAVTLNLTSLFSIEKCESFTKTGLVVKHEIEFQSLIENSVHVADSWC